MLSHGLLCVYVVYGAETFPFDPPRDTLSEEALLDLRWLNEKQAGENGWLRINSDGDFELGNGESMRIWAINSNVGRGNGNRPQWKQKDPSQKRHARWLAKLGVNMIRCHSHLNPSENPEKLMGIKNREAEWIWRTVANMKEAGIYTTVSPYWARGDLQALVFFDPEVQKAYKHWLKVLFTTPRPEFGGKTLAEEPALGIFQIQNEDSFLFWTGSRMKGAYKTLIGKQFAAWAIEKYGSLDKAMAAWEQHEEEGDDLENQVLSMVHIWHATQSAKDENNKQTQRTTDTVQFYTEKMHAFNQMIAEYIRKDLNCPVLINAGNWKTADPVLLNDLERYSYTANEVIAVNRYFGGIHNGENRGWAVLNGDEYTSLSALTDGALRFPLNLKLVQGKPMMITESAWVFPNEHAAESPFLIAAYSSLTGFDAYYWFANRASENFTPPQSANGYKPSQGKWICLTPDMAAQWPGAALAFRQGYIKKGAPVVVEHRSLAAMYQRKSPLIAETASFDPNRDAGDQPADSKFTAGVTPYAFFAGPVEVVYDSSESNSIVSDKLDALITDSGNGKEITSITGEIVMNTDQGFCTVNTAKCQGVSAHFNKRQAFSFDDVELSCANDFGAIMVVSYDGKDLKESEKVLVQVGMQCRPTDWQTAAHDIKPKDGDPIAGKKITNYGKSPWQVVSPKLQVTIKNDKLKHAHVLKFNGELRETIPLASSKGGQVLEFPADAIHVLLTP